MTGAIIWGLLVLALGVPFVLVWWRIADRWADDEHKRFKGKQSGPGPTVVRRADVEQAGGADGADGAERATRP